MISISTLIFGIGTQDPPHPLHMSDKHIPAEVEGGHSLGPVPVHSAHQADTMLVSPGPGVIQVVQKTCNKRI